MTFNLEAQLTGHVFPFLLLFTRLGAVMMLFPGVGEAYVPQRARLFFALCLCLLLLPPLSPLMPKIPDGIPALALLLCSEVLIGVFIGSLLRLLMSVLETAGAIIAVQMGLSNAMILNPTQATQSALPSAFLGSAAVALLFLTGLDYLMLRGLVHIYDLFPVGGQVLTGDIAHVFVKVLAKSFLFGVEISSPFLIIGLLLYVVLGFMQRMVQQVQLFLVALPLQIFGGIFLFAASVGVMLTVWLRFFSESFLGIING